MHTMPGLPRSEEHTSELQSPCNLVCLLLLEKKDCGTGSIQASRKKHTTPVVHRDSLFSSSAGKCTWRACSKPKPKRGDLFFFFFFYSPAPTHHRSWPSKKHRSW